ncbi:MAG: hypothetical protein J6T15_04810 [Bacilli bacterium]|nr:hypothetical protein [Bacilli bacterium]
MNNKKIELKISYLTASDVKQLEEEVNKELVAIQTNVNYAIVNVDTKVVPNGYLVQIAYADIEPKTVSNLFESQGGK